MTDEKPIALFDMDGTLCDYDGAMMRDQQEIAAPGENLLRPDGLPLWYGDNVPPHINARKKLIQDKPGWWRDLAPLFLGHRLLNLAEVHGYRRMILTKGPSTRNPNAWTEKVQWVRAHIGHTPVTITEDKGIVYGRILVDDFPEYISRWLENRPRGHVIMPAQPWNTTFSHHQVTRCAAENLDEAERIFKRMKS